MISSHILLVNCFYWCSFFLFFFYHQPKTVRLFLFLFFVFYWLNYSIHDFRATGASLDWKTWIHLNQNIWMIWMMMIGCQSQKKKKNSIVALAVKILLAKQLDAHAMLLDIVVELHVLVSVPKEELSRVAHQSSKFMSPFHQINTPL